MKRLFTVLAVLMLSIPFVAQAQQINLGPSTPIQVKGVLGTLYGGTGPVPTCHGLNNALQYNDSVTPHVFQCVTISAGTGTVTQVSPTGSNSMFALNVANQTTTPQISITLSDAINQIFVGTGAGTGSWKTLLSCSGGSNALTFDNSTQTFGCNTISGTGATTNALTAAASGGAAPGTTFNGSSAITYDFHSFGAPSTTGSGASGTWPINITGQSGSVASTLTFNSGGSGASSPQVYNGSTAFIVSYNTIGAPSVTGTGASGTWAIAITGNAGTATAFASSPTTCAAGQATIGISTTGSSLGCFTQTLHKQTFTTSGTFTIPAGVTTSTAFQWTIVGGGGAGGGGASGVSGSGGGAGAAAKVLSTGYTSGNTIAVTVGTGGIGSAGTGGGNGNNSAIASGTQTISTVTGGGGGGGVGGNSPNANYGGAGGTPTGGDADSVNGGDGSTGTSNSSSAGVTGGASIFGGGGRGFYGGSVGNGSNGEAFGSGGGGGSSNSGTSGGNGATGIVIVQWIQ